MRRSVILLPVLLLAPGAAPAAAQGTAPSHIIAAPGRRRSLTPEQVVAFYSGAVRHFNPKLAGEDSEVIARAVIDESREQSLDARFTLAALAEEGALKRVVSSGGSVKIGAQPAEKAVASLARQLSGSLRKRARGKIPTDDVLRQVLIDRASARKGKGADKPVLFASRALKTYRKLCGWE